MHNPISNNICNIADLYGTRTYTRYVLYIKEIKRK